MRAYQASAILGRHTWEEYETLGQVLRSPRECGPEGLEERGSVWSPKGRCWFWVVWEVISLKNTCCQLVVWNRLPRNYLGLRMHVQLGGIADEFSVRKFPAKCLKIWKTARLDISEFEHVAEYMFFTGLILTLIMFIVICYICFLFELSLGESIRSSGVIQL